MKLISFDVGIKNMAYCIIDCSLSINICDWNIVSLLEEEAPKVFCTCSLKPKSKKQTPGICGKVAKYKKGEECFCEIHAKSCTQYLMPTKQRCVMEIKRLKLDDLIKLGNEHNAFAENENIKTEKKPKIVEYLLGYFERNCLEPIVKKKTASASDTDLIKIGRNMKDQMNKLNKTGIDNVVIENQISPIANRMKTVQGMLAQYFIMVCPDSNIDFVSSANKLKQFGAPTKKVEKASISIENTIQVNPEYKQHKKDGVMYCSQLIDSNASLTSWKGSLDIKKKDDLADCFLQGIWYLKHRNIITFADDLKIKIV